MIEFICTINGKTVKRSVDQEQRLLSFLREDMGLVGTKNGCGEGHCGTCTVLIDGETKRSCIIKLSSCQNKRIETIESLGDTGEHPIQLAFMKEGAVQCGFCTPGMVLAAKGLLDRIHHPTLEQMKEALRHNICRCTGYGAIYRSIEQAAIAMYGPYEFPLHLVNTDTSEKEQYVGKSVIKKDAQLKVTGARMFAGDYNREGQIYGRILFSEYAHARIQSIDIEEASHMEGVHYIALAKDVPGINRFGLFVPQQPVLADEQVKYLGDCVACVYADSEAVAKKAAAAIQVTYLPLAAQLDPQENMKKESPLFHEGTTDNIVHHVAVRKGDVHKGFEEAEVVIGNTYQTQAVEHAYMEPESCLCYYDGDVLTLYSGNQGSEAYRKMIADNLDIPIEKVRVIFTATGGGFGGKEEPTVQLLASLGTYLTKQPVKMVLTRQESIRMSTKRHPMTLRMKHGVTRDGRITALESYVVGDAGAYISQTNPVIFRSAVTASGPYDTEHVQADSYGVYTHKNPSGAFRGFGSTQASFACESQIDQLAHAIGMSPYELRRKNGFKRHTVTSTGQVLQDGIGYIKTLDAVYEAMEKMKKEIEITQYPEHIKIGYGLASAYKNVGIGTGLADGAGAYVELLENGRILVSIGAADMGQGVDTVMAQIAAETIRVSYDWIDVIACDTKICPDGGMTTASRQTYVTGNAVLEAAAAFRKTLIQKQGLDKEVWFTCDMLMEAARVYRQEGRLLKIEHVYYPPKTYKHRVDANHKPGEDVSTYDIHYSYCFASASVAVAVDTKTGEVEVLKVAAAQDVGKAIHPKNIIGQIEGAVAMGVGLALTEDYVVDERTIHHNTFKKLGVLNTQKMPQVEAIIVEEEQQSGPYGAKGMGEVGLNPVAPAIANAIFDATGVRLTTIPMKPERVLAALKGQ